MNTAIRAFGHALTALLSFLQANVIQGIFARAELVWENFDNWLADHGLTLAQFIGLVTMFITVVIVDGLVISTIGLLIGTVLDSPTTARVFITVGMLVGAIGFLPLALTYWFARGIFDLMFHTGEACARLLEKDQKGIPQRLRQQLKQLRKESLFPIAPHLIFAGYLSCHLLMFAAPFLWTVLAIPIIAAALYVTMSLRVHLQIKGFGLRHFAYAALLALWFAVPTYVALGLLDTQYFIQMFQIRHLGKWSNAVGAIQFFGTGLVLAVSCFAFCRTTHSVPGDEALDKGDVLRGNYTKRPTGLTPEGKAVYSLEATQPTLPGFLKKPGFWLLVGAVICVAFYGFGPIASAGHSVLHTMNMKTLLTIGLLAFITILITGKKH